MAQPVAEAIANVRYANGCKIRKRNRGCHKGCASRSGQGQLACLRRHKHILARKFFKHRCILRKIRGKEATGFPAIHCDRSIVW
jgi:hypothetical protein